MTDKQIKLKRPNKEAVEFCKKFIEEHDKGLKAIKVLEEIKEIIKDPEIKGNAFCDVRLFDIQEIVSEVLKDE